MLRVIQLEDGCYRVTVDFSCDAFSVHREYTFRETESDAEPLKDGNRIELKFDNE